MLNPRTVVAAGLVALFALGATAASALPKGTERPIAGSSSGTTETTAIIAGGLFRSTSTGSMIMSHLGKGTYVIDAVQSWDTDFAGQCVEDGGSTLIGETFGTVEWTAANGDTLTGTIILPAVSQGDPLASYVCEIGTTNTSYASTLTIEITGGTGRFANASGTIVATGTSTFLGLSGPATAEYESSGSLVGSVSY